ncbi:cyanophycinase [Gracilimonas amylolytica]|uniref:cyanophycinase n=1 Tax=Gracilimonas amylolytica TaxID=1749045 RepID=UPI001E2B3D55|nr:cyanophycinase [Gracilimonas amylolytica]
MKYFYQSFILLLILLTGCDSSQPLSEKGALMIIGGGSRPDVIIERILDESDLSDPDAFGLVLTMSGFNPDTSGFYGEKPFRDNGFENMYSFDLGRKDSVTSGALDSVRNAAFMYIAGGDQSRFMKQVEDHPEIGEAIYEAYSSGAVISGSSAGAAIMSRIMITGDQAKHPEYTSTFYHLEKDNLVTNEGLGLVEGIIVDQHFVKRARNNRLITAVMEYPDHKGVGIDESTAILVRGDRAEVVGLSQVLLYGNSGEPSVTESGLFKGEGLSLDIYTHGDSFLIR